MRVSSADFIALVERAVDLLAVIIGFDVNEALLQVKRSEGVQVAREVLSTPADNHRLAFGFQ